MRRPRDPRRNKKQRPVAALAGAALIVVVSVPYVALHLPQQRTHRTEATPIIPDERHDQPFAIYDAFAAANAGPRASARAARASARSATRSAKSYA